MEEWVDKKSQKRKEMGLVKINEDKQINNAIQKEQIRKEKKERKREELLCSYSYVVSEKIAKYMDKYFLDGIIGLFPGFGDVFSSVCVMPQLYLSLFKIKSIPLTLAVLLNVMIDIAVGLIPFWIGNICDFFHRAYLKNFRLIAGFVNDDKDIIKEVNAKAFVSAILIVIMIGIIYLLISLMSKLVDWIVSLF
jgi:hypothetical protein